MAVGLTNLNNFGYAQSFGNSTLTNSLGTSSNPLFTMTNNNYEEDMLMPAELKMSAMTSASNPVQTQNTNTSQTSIAQTTESFTGNQTNTQQAASAAKPDAEEISAASTQNSSELSNYLLAKDKNITMTESGNPYKETNAGKKSLAVLGFLAPAAGKIVQLFKGGKFKELFKFKQLAIACPAVALAGFGIGTLIDGYVNSQRAKNADTQQTNVNAGQGAVYKQMSVKA